MSQQQKDSRQPLLGRIEEMINSVRLDTRIARQPIGHKQLGEAGHIVKHMDHGRLLNAHNRGCAQCGGGRPACPLPDEAAFTKEAALL